MTNTLLQQLKIINDYDAGERQAICEGAVAEIAQLRGNLSLAEEGLANYALEVERKNSLIDLQAEAQTSLHAESVRLRACWSEALANVTARNQEIERLCGALQTILDFSDLAMGDGDGARDVARAALGAHAHEPLSCACIPLAPRTGKYCSDCGGRIGAGIPPDGAPSMPFDTTTPWNPTTSSDVPIHDQTPQKSDEALCQCGLNQTACSESACAEPNPRFRPAERTNEQQR